MKTFLEQEKAALESSRKRIVAKRLEAINRRNEYQITLLGDLVSYLDDALHGINFELKSLNRKAPRENVSRPRR
jgi:hypothetical protein